MSSTVLFAAFDDGDMIQVGLCDNAYTGAMHVWSSLGEKHLGSARAVSTMPAKLWGLATDHRLSEDERLTLVSTFDRAFVRRENILRVADALDNFSPASGNIKHQANYMRNAHRNGARVFAWQQTTVADDLNWSVETDGGEDSRPFNIDSDVLTGPEVKPATPAE
jgi:hypothetical protein